MSKSVCWGIDRYFEFVAKVLLNGEPRYLAFDAHMQLKRWIPGRLGKACNYNYNYKFRNKYATPLTLLRATMVGSSFLSHLSAMSPLIALVTTPTLTSARPRRHAVALCTRDPF